MTQQLIECLEDTLEWLTTGKVDGVGFDEQQIIENLQRTLDLALGE